MKRLLLLGLMGIFLSMPVFADAFEDKTAIPEPVVSKQRAERVVIYDQDGKPALMFILVYDEEGLPARFLLVDRANQVFLDAPQVDGR